MASKILKFFEQAGPLLIFIIAVSTGMTFGSWATSAILIIAIALMAHYKKDELENMRVSFAFLFIVSLLSTYSNLILHATLEDVRKTCEREENVYSNPCGNILVNISNEYLLYNDDDY